MRIDDHTRDANSPPDRMPGEEEKEESKRAANELVETEKESQPVRRTTVPAKLPAHSQAAVAQRLNDVPEKPAPGFFYEATHHPQHPTGWRTERHLKRKHLRGTFWRMTKTERAGTRTMLNLAFAIVTTIVIITTIFIAVTGFIQATNNRYGEKITRLEDIIPKDSMRIYDSHGKLLYTALDQGLQISVPLDKISPNMYHAQIAIEDQNFWKNPGYDITGIVRAALDYLSHGKVMSGGSTITQQLIKNTIVGNRVDVMRKLQELILAPDATRQYTKEQILTMYLNTTYYGEQAYGVEAAAFMYYNKHASNLTIAEAAMLAGAVSSPYERDPYVYPETAYARMQQVLQEMYLQGYITADQRSQALLDAKKPNFLKRGNVNNRLAPHFTSYVQRELSDRLHVKLADLSRAGLVVSTTLDLGIQNKVLEIARKQIQAMQGHNMTNASEVVIDPHTGGIITLLGNVDPDNPTDGSFDVASQGFRQPGSSFKPYAYVTAFEQGISPGEPILDAPVTYQMCCGLPSYTPSNYDLRFHGWMTYRNALQESLNIPALKVVNQVGVEKALNTAKTLGISEYVGSENMTLVLGALGIHLLDHAQGYTVFANGGNLIEKHSVNTVKDSNGNVIWEYKVQPKRVLSPQATFILTDVLSDNVARTPEFGKCSPLLLYSTTEQQCYAGNPGQIRPAAAKTGTTNDFKDSLTMGYTPDYVVGVWVGNNDSTSMVDVTGIMGAAPIWHDVMNLLHQGKPVKNFTNPGGVEKRTVNYGPVTSTDWYITKKTK
jgi:membrane peptidoglycan carboxypeptidase